LGLIVQTLTTRPRPWGQERSRGVLERGALDLRVEEGARHWLSVAMNGQLRGPGIAPGRAGYEPAGRLDAPLGRVAILCLFKSWG
jgi:hypothetical protein